MSAPFEIPLSPQPQTFNITVGSVVYLMSVHWCSPSGLWLLDIFDVNSNPLIYSIPLVCGIDLLFQYSYLGFNFSLYAQTDHDSEAPPTFDNLGVTGRLYAVLPS